VNIKAARLLEQASQRILQLEDEFKGLKQDILLVVAELKQQPSLIPKDWSPNSNASYYRESYAMEVKGYLDSMNIGKDLVIPKEKIRRSNKKTMIQKLHQGWLYLCENCDPTGKYAEMRKRIQIVKLPGGVALIWKSSK
jgi:hypothetical protein